MKLMTRRATVLLCSVAVAAHATSALARPVHHPRHGAAANAQAAIQPQMTGADSDARYSFNGTQAATEITDDTIVRSRRHGRVSLAEARAQAQSHSNSAFGGATIDGLVSEARKYIGTNPTRRRSLWCGAFIELVLQRTGHAGGGNLGSAYARYGQRVSGPQVGAIAVMGRRGGGHVRAVGRAGPKGKPTSRSGKHNHNPFQSGHSPGRVSPQPITGC